MKKYFFTRESLLAIGIFMFSFTHIWAQNGVKDSLYKELPKPVLDEVYQLKFKEVLVPVMGIGTAALFVAAITGYLRIYNDRHYLNDVVAGACIGVLSTKLAYWLYPKIFKKSECYKEHVAIVTLPYYSAKEVGLNMCICF